MEAEIIDSKQAFSKELRLMLSLLKDNISEAWKNEELRDVDWSLFVRYVRHHRVFPAVYLRLKELNCTEVPQSVMHALSTQYRRNALRMLQFSSEMNTVCGALQAEGIRSIILKGPVVAAYLYGDVSLRVSKDLDLLIAESDIERAEQILLGFGYEHDHEIPRILEDWKRRNYHVTYTQPQTGIQVEVHWRLNPDPGNEPSFEELWQRRVSDAAFGHAVHRMGDADLFYYLVSHGARHAWFRLRWLEDMKQLVRKRMEWAEVLLSIRQFDAQAVTGQTVQLLSGCLSEPIPQALVPFLGNKRGRRLTQEVLPFISVMHELSGELPKPIHTAFHKYLFRIKTLKQKAVYIAGLLAPTSYDVQFFPLPKPLHFLYVPLRPILWLLRRRRKQQLAGDKL